VVKPRGQHHQQIIEQQRFKFQIELNCLVIQLHIGHLEMSKDAHSEQKRDCRGIQMKDRNNLRYSSTTEPPIQDSFLSLEISLVTVVDLL